MGGPATALAALLGWRRAGGSDTTFMTCGGGHCGGFMTLMALNLKVSEDMQQNTWFSRKMIGFSINSLGSTNFQNLGFFLAGARGWCAQAKKEK